MSIPQSPKPTGRRPDHLLLVERTRRTHQAVIFLFFCKYLGGKICPLPGKNCRHARRKTSSRNPGYATLQRHREQNTDLRLMRAIVVDGH
jgi:hypothetical protein